MVPRASAPRIINTEECRRVIGDPALNSRSGTFLDYT